MEWVPSAKDSNFFCKDTFVFPHTANSSYASRKGLRVHGWNKEMWLGWLLFATGGQWGLPCINSATRVFRKACVSHTMLVASQCFPQEILSRNKNLFWPELRHNSGKREGYHRSTTAKAMDCRHSQELLAEQLCHWAALSPDSCSHIAASFTAKKIIRLHSLYI